MQTEDTPGSPWPLPEAYPRSGQRSRDEAPELEAAGLLHGEGVPAYSSNQYSASASTWLKSLSGSKTMLSRWMPRTLRYRPVPPVYVDYVFAALVIGVYELGRAWAGCAPADIGFVSANAWDAGGAAGSGFRTFWVNRNALPPEYEIDRHATVIADLSALADALR